MQPSQNFVPRFSTAQPVKRESSDFKALKKNSSEQSGQSK